MQVNAITFLSDPPPLVPRVSQRFARLTSLPFAAALTHILDHGIDI